MNEFIMRFMHKPPFAFHIKFNTLFCIVIFFAITSSCGRSPKTAGKADADSISIKLAKNLSAIKNAASLIKDGDLVTRSDDDFESLSLQNFSKKDRTYSHSGIAFREDNIWYVYHSMAGAENPGGFLKRDPFDSFLNPMKKTGFGLFRYPLSPAEIDSFHVLYKKYYSQKLPFDKSFNLQNEDSMYCSEIIYRALKKVTGNRVVLPTSTLTNFKPKLSNIRAKNVFFKKFEYVGLDDLYLNAFCTEIRRASFK